MTAQIYERFSTVYDLDWGKWSLQYVALIQEMLAQLDISHANILDLACGTGTLAVELAKLGHYVLGVDISPDMIEVAKSKAAKLANVSFRVQDMAHFTTNEEFDCVTCTFDSLNYLLSIGDLRTVIANVATALQPHGLFIFDCNTDQLYLTGHKGTYQRELGGESFLQKFHYDPEKRIATTIFEFSDGTIEVHKQRPYTLESKRLICIAKKQK